MKRIIFAALFPAIASAQQYPQPQQYNIFGPVNPAYANPYPYGGKPLGEILSQKTAEYNHDLEVQQQQRFIGGLEVSRQVTDQIMLKEILDQQQKQFDALYGR